MHRRDSTGGVVNVRRRESMPREGSREREKEREGERDKGIKLIGILASLLYREKQTILFSCLYI